MTFGDHRGLRGTVGQNLLAVCGFLILFSFLFAWSRMTMLQAQSFGKVLYHYRDASGSSHFLPNPIENPDGSAQWAFEGTVSVFLQAGPVSIFGQRSNLAFLSSGRRITASVAGIGIHPELGYSVPQANQAGLNVQVAQILHASMATELLTEQELAKILLTRSSETYIDVHILWRLIRSLIMLFVLISIGACLIRMLVIIYFDIYLPRKRLLNHLCPACGYKLPSITSIACPECGRGMGEAEPE